LLGEIGHRRVDSLSDSFNNMTINVAEVSWPLLLLWHLSLFRSHVVIQVFDESVNFLSFAFNDVETGSDHGVVDVLNIFRSLSSVLSLEQRSLTPQVGDCDH